MYRVRTVDLWKTFIDRIKTDIAMFLLTPSLFVKIKHNFQCWFFLYFFFITINADSVDSSDGKIILCNEINLKHNEKRFGAEFGQSFFFYCFLVNSH